MPFKCSAFGCTSGYDSQFEHTSDQPKITFHSVPMSDEILLQQWIKANPRLDWKPTKNSKLCSLHFQDSDFETSSTDTNAARRKKLERSADRPFLRRLKRGAIPSKFPNAPSYLSTTQSAIRNTTLGTAASRHEQASYRLSQLEESFNNEDDIRDLHIDMLADRLRHETTLPTGFLINIVDGSLCIYFLQLEDGVAKIRSNITISRKLSVFVCHDGHPVPVDQYHDLVSNKGCISKLSQLVNPMARLKSWQTDDNILSWQNRVKMAVSLLNDAVDSLMTVDPESDQQRTVKFVIQQLKLIIQDKFHRHYSPDWRYCTFHHPFH